MPDITPTMIAKRGLMIEVRLGQGIRQSDSVEALLLFEILSELKKQNSGKYPNER